MNQICKIEGNPEDEKAIVGFFKDVYGWKAKIQTNADGERILMCNQPEGKVLPILTALMGIVDTVKEIKNAG